jgi:hypothetical protein
VPAGPLNDLITRLRLRDALGRDLRRHQSVPVDQLLERVTLDVLLEAFVPSRDAAALEALHGRVIARKCL